MSVFNVNMRGNNTQLKQKEVNAFVCVVVALLMYENYKGKHETDIFFLLKVKYSKDKHSV